MTDTKKKYMMTTLIKDFVVILCAIFIFQFVLGVKIQSGNNMFPAVKDGDLVVYFRLDDPIRTETVIYRAKNKDMVGRVVAGPGDIVNISETGELSVNGGVVAEEVFYATDLPDNSQLVYPYTVPSGSYFILNDFRSDISDSRSIGGVPKKDVKGTAIFIVRRRGI